MIYVQNDAKLKHSHYRIIRQLYVIYQQFFHHLILL